MGFFSSVKHSPVVGEDRHTIHVVRSRFYGKGKEKARESQTFPLPTSGPPFGRHGLPEHDVSRYPLSRSTRTATDAVTMTLAQRLNELALANDQGLLDDDEYRLLRQSLFERFATSSAIPTESPIVRLSGLGRSPTTHVSTTSARPESVRSGASISSTVSGLFRRLTSRRTSSNYGDSVSITSIGSCSPKTPSSTFPRRSIGRQSSWTSLHSERSQVQGFISYREPRSMSPNTRRCTKNVPPSSFSARGTRGTTTNSQRSERTGEEHIQSVKEIRQEIEAVEAEGRRLLDAFNGLELSTLTRSHRQPIGAISISSPSTYADSDTMSVHSGGSMSLKRSPNGRVTGNLSPLISQPITLSRKNSMSSISSRSRNIGNPGSVPAVPPLPNSFLGRLGVGSTSSVNLSRNPGYYPLATVEEKGIPLGSLSCLPSDSAMQTLESEMTEIRRRRAEVVGRYQSRLEFLRVKLKGAEMHEKLLRR